MTDDATATAAETGAAGRLAYEQFVEMADRLAQPLIALMQPGQSSLPIEGQASDHGEDADRLEAFARPLLLLCLWLHGRRQLGASNEADTNVIAWIHQAMRLGSTPGTPAYWGTLTNYHQHAVEFAIIAMALQVGEAEVWETADAETRDCFLLYFSQIRGHGGHRNNHLFFDVLCLEFLAKHGASELGDDAAINHHLDELEAMHRGEGWFIDGGNESYDHYNAYAFHIYGLWWASRHGDRDPRRAERWIKLAADFLPSYAALFASSGEPVPIGRSLAYRFNGVGVFALAAACCIDAVDLGEARRLSRRCINFFLDHPIDQSQGCLSVGWTDHFDDMAEPYTCAASPYWAAKGLLALSLGPDHPFFAADEQPFAAERSESGHDNALVISTPGWLVRHRAGRAILVNAGGSSSMSAMKRFGAWKWGKLMYSTGVGGLQCGSPLGDPLDVGLTARLSDETPLIGRHNTIPITVSDDRIVCQYQLGEPYSGVNVSVCTHLWLVGDWVVALHTGRAHQPTQLCHGAFAIADPVQTTEQGLSAEATSTRFRTYISNVSGFTGAAIDVGTERQHLYSSRHAVPYLYTDEVHGEYCVACMWMLAEPGEERSLMVEAIEAGTATFVIDGKREVLHSPHWQKIQQLNQS